MEIKQESENRYCRNCHHPLPAKGKFCPTCSQKYTTGKESIGSIFLEFFSSAFNYDSKLFSSLRKLFIPGFLTIAYFKGHHKRYIHPVRLFLVMMLVHFAVFNFIAKDNFKLGLDEGGLHEINKQINAQEFIDNLEKSKQEILKRYPAPETAEAIDSLMNSAFGKNYNGVNDSITISFGKYGLPLLNSDKSFVSQKVKIAKKDIFRLTPNELIEQYKIEGFIPQSITKQIIKVGKDGKGFVLFLLGKITWMLLIMMPLLAIVLKLFYVRHDRFYVEHLIFSFHYHSFAFLILSLTYIAAALALFSDSVIALAFPMILCYLFLAIYKVYGQGVGKTFLKFCLLNFIYIFLFVISLFFTLLLGLVLF